MGTGTRNSPVRRRREQEILAVTRRADDERAQGFGKVKKAQRNPVIPAFRKRTLSRKQIRLRTPSNGRVCPMKADSRGFRRPSLGTTRTEALQI